MADAMAPGRFQLGPARDGGTSIAFDSVTDRVNAINYGGLSLVTGAADPGAALACGAALVCGADGPDAGAVPFVGAGARIGQGEADAAGLRLYGADRSRGQLGRIDCSGGSFAPLAGFDIAGVSAALVMSAVPASPTVPGLIGFDNLDGVRPRSWTLISGATPPDIAQVQTGVPAQGVASAARVTFHVRGALGHIGVASGR